jgi:hypothetical protein
MNTTKGSPRGTNRKTAIIVGILYIIGTVAGISSVFLAGPNLGNDYLARVVSHGNTLMLGALAVLVMGFALAFIPFLLFPIFPKRHWALASGYVVFRGALETVSTMALAACWWTLVSVGREFPAALASVGPALRMGGDAGQLMGSFAFGIGALVLYSLLFMTRLVPRWISVWGFIAIVMQLASAFLQLFGALSSTAALDTILNLPILVQEMVMAVWLIAKGFNPSAIAALSAKIE